MLRCFGEGGVLRCNKLLVAIVTSRHLSAQIRSKRFFRKGPVLWFLCKGDDINTSLTFGASNIVSQRTRPALQIIQPKVLNVILNPVSNLNP